MDRQRLSKEERRKQIKEIALKLFVDRGYSKTTMDDIIQAVGISKGGVYHHFSNKEEIFLELLKDGSSYRKKVVLEHMNGSVQDRGEKIIDILLDKILDKNQYKDLYTVFLIEMQTNDRFKEMYKKIYEEVVEDFARFCNKEGLYEYKATNNQEFIFLMNCLYMGIYLFDDIDMEKLRYMLKIMFNAYLKH